MKKETVKKVEEEIKRKTKMPEKVKAKIRKEMYLNIVIAIIVVLYFTFLITGSFGTIKVTRQIDFKIFSIILLSMSIILFEVAYKKDSGKYALFGIESLLYALATLFFPYIIFELNTKHKIFYLIVSGYVGLYYIIKCIFIYNRHKKDYNKQVSDIKEIVKPKRKIDNEESEESVIKKHNIKKEVEVKKEIKETKKEIPEKKEKSVKKETKKQEKIVEEKAEKPKRGRPKKQQTEVETKVEEAPKRKRGRPKKEDKVVNEIKKEEAPKKRGRPRKVVK